MGNVNFSADMVGIQTLAQQGIACGGESVLSTGVSEGGSFDDMIMQMIANNLTIEPIEDVGQVLTAEASDENDKSPQEIVMDAIMCGIAAPEIFISDLSGIYTDNMSVQTSDAEIVADNIPIVSVDGEVLADKTVSDKTIITPKGADTDIKMEAQTDFSQTVRTSDKAEFVKNTEPRDNNIPVSYEVKAEIKAEVKADIKAEMENDNKASVSEKTEFSDFRTIKSYAKADVSVHAESDSTEGETSNDALNESFISTADMLQMRLGNKVDFSNERVAFKVAQTPVNMESPNAVKDLTDRILMKFNEKEFEVELYPKSLGKIAISLVLDNGIVKVAMNAENEKVNAFLASQSANIQSIVEKNTQYSAVVKVDDSQNQYQQQQRDNSQYGADENQKQRQQEHMQQMYRQNIQHTEDFLSMLSLV